MVVSANAFGTPCVSAIPSVARPDPAFTNSESPDDTVIPVGNLLIGGGGFLVMAGPCSVESADQITTTARAVREAGAQILRGGVFKPRTSPYAAQGLRPEGAWDGAG